MTPFTAALCEELLAVAAIVIVAAVIVNGSAIAGAVWSVLQ